MSKQLEKMTHSEFVQDFLSKVGLHKLTPPKAVQEVKTMDPEELSNKDLHAMNVYILALGQYIVYVRAKYNIARVKLKEYSRFYDLLVYNACRENKSLKTKDDKRIFAEENDENILRHGNQLRKLDSAKCLLDNYVESLVEMNNNVKRAYDQKLEEWRMTKRERDIGEH